MAAKPEEHLRHAVVSVRQNVGEVSSMPSTVFEGVQSDAGKRCHGTSASDLEVGRIEAAAVAIAVEVKAVAGTHFKRIKCYGLGLGSGGSSLRLTASDLFVEQAQVAKSQNNDRHTPS